MGPGTQPRGEQESTRGAHPFQLDRFQLDAIDAVDAGRHVVVAAPTGSGKTVVAEHAIEVARRRRRRAFYTAPIKALSNQKFHDLVEWHGADAVGLLTGDNSINPDAPVVVMTTEVLRNMIYARQRGLDDLAVVVLDEVHFLQDAYRGPVWEEVIIHLPSHVQLVCLSATVSNAAELASWITTVRGPTVEIVERRRPVRLDNMYLVADRTEHRLRLLPTFVDGRPNRDALRLDESGVRPGRGRRHEPVPSGTRRLATPGRVETIELLRRRGLLPVIYFIFSRQQCDEAAAACRSAGIDLTNAEERRRIREIADHRLGSFESHDLGVLGVTTFVAHLEAGVAAHHAGMVPPFKEVVETCFLEGLVKVVFATETLAVGINMPARSVVIEKLTKFTGERHELLTPGQYTQLTGRAGRRGIDELGHAVVCWSPFVRFEQVAELAGSTAFELRSVFRPTYNMVANLVRNHPAEQARHLLNLSFAQYQADRAVVRQEARLERLRARRAELSDGVPNDADHDEAVPDAVADSEMDRWSASLATLRPGDVVRVEADGYVGHAAVVATANRRAGVRVTVITAAGDELRLTATDLHEPPQPCGSISLPAVHGPRHGPHRREFRRDVARRIRAAGLAPVATHARRRPRSAQVQRLTAEIRELEERIARQHHSLARDFDRVLGVLERFGYVDVQEWRLTDVGEVLARVFHECDLVVVECLRRGLLDDLDPASLAGVVSMFVYEHRSPDDPMAPWFPSAEVTRRAQQVLAVSAELSAAESAAGLDVHRGPDPTFLAAAYAWVAGESFAEVVGDDDLTGGDFVRTTKQLIDLLRQIGAVADRPETRRAARRAADAASRGVIADSSITPGPS